MAAQIKSSFMLALCSRQIPANANKLILSYLMIDVAVLLLVAHFNLLCSFVFVWSYKTSSIGGDDWWLFKSGLSSSSRLTFSQPVFCLVLGRGVHCTLS